MAGLLANRQPIDEPAGKPRLEDRPAGQPERRFALPAHYRPAYVSSTGRSDADVVFDGRSREVSDTFPIALAVLWPHPPEPDLREPDHRICDCAGCVAGTVGLSD